MSLSMITNALNQKTDATSKTQLFKIYNFVALEWTNVFWPSKKVVYIKKLIFETGVRFLIQCIFEHAQRPLVDF